MNNIPSSSRTQTLTFPAQFESLLRIGEFVTRAARSAGLDSTAVYAVEMAVDEACTNIIEHAYGGEGRGEIECTCQMNSHALKVTLRDFGSSFDPSSVPEPNITASLEEREAGGLGLFLMRKLMDEVSFEFTPDSGNVLTMVKRKETIS
ncbi:MAG: ATP-binding protein [Anaerolineales bacterium]|nr:MAG: ATP-binding protein [Anaerolineales bacterium]